jgi:hypothetical protein
MMLLTPLAWAQTASAVKVGDKKVIAKITYTCIVASKDKAVLVFGPRIKR